jgi:hypothetical protein
VNGTEQDTTCAAAKQPGNTIDCQSTFCYSQPSSKGTDGCYSRWQGLRWYRAAVSKGVKAGRDGDELAGEAGL